MRILLAVDESPCSQEAVRRLLTQFQRRGVQILVLNVVQQFSTYVPSGMVPHLEELEIDRRKQAATLVARTAQKLRKAGFLRITEAVESGDAKSLILDRAAKWNADLIVLGSHGLTGLPRLLMGSVSDAVVHHATCSVQVVRVRRAAKGPGRIPKRTAGVSRRIAKLVPSTLLCFV